MINYDVNKKSFKIAVLCGGFEPENYASNLTGENIYKALQNAGYKKVTKLSVGQDIALKLIESKPDFAFLTLFCKWGEDGVVQGLLETLNIPYTGSGVETSSLCKNKYFFNRFVKGCGLFSPENYFYGSKEEFEKTQRANIKFPCIVKPVYQGYSLGVSYVYEPQNLEQAIDNALVFSSKFSVEEYIAGRELTIGVIDHANKGPTVLPIIEIKFKNGEIQDTLAKDDPTMLIEEVPAKLSKSQEERISNTVLYLYNKLGCVGSSRFDTRLDVHGNLYFLENNTCPGILSYEFSDLPKQLRAIDITLEEYVDHMIQAGLSRPENKLEYIC